MSASAKTSKPSRALWAALLLPPVLWMAQEAMGWFLGGESCPAAGAAWSARTVRVVVQVLTAVSLVVVASSLALAHRHRQATLPGAGAATERARFVATLAMVAGVTLLLGLSLAGLPAVMVQTCGQAR